MSRFQCPGCGFVYDEDQGDLICGVCNNLVQQR